MTPAAIISRRSGRKSSFSSVLMSPLLTLICACPGSLGGIKRNSARPSSTKVCNPGSAGFKSSTFQRPSEVERLMATREVTGTSLRSKRLTTTRVGVFPSAIAPPLVACLNEIFTFANAPGATTLMDFSPRTLPNWSTCETDKVFSPTARSIPINSHAWEFFSANTAFLPTRSSPMSLSLTFNLSVAPAAPFTRTVACAYGNTSPVFKPMKPSVLS